MGGNRNCKGWGWLLEVFSLGAPSKIGNYQKQRLCWPSYQLVYCLQSLKIKNIVFIDDLLFTVGWMIFLHLTSGYDRLMNKLLVIYLFLYCTIYCGIHGNVLSSKPSYKTFLSAYPSWKIMEIPGGGGLKQKCPPCMGVWIFSWTTHSPRVTVNNQENTRSILNVQQYLYCQKGYYRNTNTNA